MEGALRVKNNEKHYFSSHVLILEWRVKYQYDKIYYEKPNKYIWECLRVPWDMKEMT